MLYSEKSMFLPGLKDKETWACSVSLVVPIQTLSLYVENGFDDE